MSKRGIPAPRKRLLTGSGSRSSWTEVFKNEDEMVPADNLLDDLQRIYQHRISGKFEERSELETRLRSLVSPEAS